MAADDVKRYIKGLNNLSTLPALLGRIIAAANDENASPDDFHKLVSFDQALAQRVLRYANSALLGHSGQIKDIDQAIMFLGTDRIRSIAIGMSVLDVFPSRTGFNIQNLWVHSYEVAYLAAVLSERVSITQPQECFLAGLLHDVGRVVLYTMDSKKFLKIETTDTMLEQETAVFGCTHGEAGGWFAESIGLPHEIISTIRYHHHPSVVQEGREIASVISLAEALSRQISPHIEDDGIWTREHDAILLELSLTQSDISSVVEKFTEVRPEIDNFFPAKEP
ncbi:MAG: HDOD domain-containing protein [Nitrospirae bacterium]|nr:HDOD domain-containing protein [Nitrospirota bacterium]